MQSKIASTLYLNSHHEASDRGQHNTLFESLTYTLYVHYIIWLINRLLS